MADYTIKVNEAQARVLCNALEMFSRIQTGQFWAAAQPWFGHDNHHDLEKALDSIRHYVFPNLQPNANLGIHHPDVAEKAKIAWDMQQAIRHRLSWESAPEGGWSVNYDRPLKAGTEPLARVITDKSCPCKYPDCRGKY